MIAFTYLMSGLLLALTGWLFAQGMLSAREQTLAWSVIFFFASAAASSAYLTVSETFPLEIRALAIALFYAVGTGIGGVIGPLLFGALIDTGSRMSLFGGYLLGAALMIVAAAVMWRWGVAAERKPLEQVARPLAFHGLMAVARRDRRRPRSPCGVDAAIRVIEGLHQRRGNREIADAGIRIDIDRGAAHDALGHLQPRGADRDLLPEQAEFVPGRPACDVQVGAEAQRMDRHADHGLDRRHGRKIDDRDHLGGDIREAVAVGAASTLGGPRSSAGMKRRKNASIASRPSRVDRSPRASSRPSPRMVRVWLASS